MKQVWVIQGKMAIEFQNGEFTKWDEIPTVYYGIEEYEEAKKEITKLRNEETNNYKNWLHKKSGVFIHHHYEFEALIIFTKACI